MNKLKHKKDRKIQLENGNTIIAYPSHDGFMVCSENCTTKYSRIGETNIYKLKK